MALSYQWQRRLDKLKSVLRGPFGGGDRQPRPKLCPACNALVGVSATRCHECGTSLRFSLAAITKSLPVFSGMTSPVSTTFVGLNFFVFAIQLMFTIQAGQAGGFNLLWHIDGASAYRLGENTGRFVFEDGEYWRFVTAMFLHGGLIHIGFNMMALMQFGPAVEELYGSPRFLFLYTSTGAFGFLVSAFFVSHALCLMPFRAVR